MQTFLPYADFEKSARCLDPRRLGKQRVEAYTLLKVMLNPELQGWRNHPAFKIWDGYDFALISYGMTMCDEWRRRGYEDNLFNKFWLLYSECTIRNQLQPPIIGYEPYHASHRSNLLRKDPNYYEQFGWTEPHDLPYIWRKEE